MFRVTLAVVGVGDLGLDLVSSPPVPPQDSYCNAMSYTGVLVTSKVRWTCSSSNALPRVLPHAGGG